MGLYTVKPKFQKLLSPIKDYFVRHRVSPTVINTCGLLLSFVAAGALFFSYKNSWLLLSIPILAFVRTALNALDGLVSRELRIASRFGEVLNEFFDRISDAAIFWGLALIPFVNPILGGTTVIIILLNSYLSIVSKAAGGTRQYGGFMGKADRMLYLSVAALIIFFLGNVIWWNYFLVFILAGTIVTLLQRFMNIKKELS